MLHRKHLRPQSFVAAGLLGIALYWILARPGQPLAHTSDAVRGAWFGVCLGLEIIGVMRLTRRKSRPNAA